MGLSAAGREKALKGQAPGSELSPVMTTGFPQRTVPVVLTPAVQLRLHPAPACLAAFITVAANTRLGPALPPQPCV